MKTKVHFTKTLPSFSNPKGSILIYDKAVFLKSNPKVRKWLKSFPLRYGLRGGEELKDAKNFPKHISQIVHLAAGLSRSEIKIISVGGGSVGDFAGFIASILKRGVPLVHVPSTWLAAIDSAHGGKNALNVEGIKNQIGTFYPASEVWMIKEILFSQPLARTPEAWGEVVKIAILDGPKLFQKIATHPIKPETLWRLLPDLVRAKYKIVKKDPSETKGIRYLLNLGHTVGHVIEADQKVPHGVAVWLGLSFSARWSCRLGLLSQQQLKKIEPLLANGSLVLSKIKNPRKYLMQDKKLSKDKKVKFIFVKGIGKPLIRSVKIEEVIQEIRRQGML